MKVKLNLNINFPPVVMGFHKTAVTVAELR